MKVAIFIDNFFEAQKYKDPGVIASTLLSLDNQVVIYAFNSDSDNFNGIQIKKISKASSKNPVFWSQEDFDSIIVYSWLSLRFSVMIEALKNANKKVILKLDSDGHLLAPFKPTYLRTFGKNNSPSQILIFLLRVLQWSLFLKIVNKKRIKQLIQCNSVIIESPKAADNLKESLKYQKKDELISKIKFIQNPVNNEIIQSVESTDIKEKLILCVGRWDDNQKNQKGLTKSLQLTNLNGWKIIILGNKSTNIKNKLAKYNLNLEAIENVPHHMINNYFNKSSIFFSSSKYEGFNISAVEAVCCGCSLVGTPLECFQYFSQDGQFGTISKTFKPKDISEALETEISKWDNNLYNPEEMSKYWINELSPENIGEKIQNLIAEL